jgi:hypothetical protein
MAVIVFKSSIIHHRSDRAYKGKHLVRNRADAPRPRALHLRAQADPREGHEGMVIRRESASAAVGRYAGSGQAWDERQGIRQETLRVAPVQESRYSDAVASCDLGREKQDEIYVAHYHTILYMKSESYECLFPKVGRHATSETTPCPRPRHGTGTPLWLTFF